MSLDPQRAEFVCRAALALSREERAAYLDRTCGNDAELRQHVEKLLQAHQQAGDASSLVPGQWLEREATTAPTETAGTRIGPYKLLQKLGEGGMGTVWMAEQQDPVQRRVALKVIKSGMDSTHVLARFEAERQALALMDHPNIARVLDAGATPDGGPFVVMELVKGIPITKFCDQEQLSPKERLQLFIPVCQAVQHAHQKGIIHRDIKPSNVLIALYDGKAVPKIIDFGVAKATGQKLTEKTMFTEVGQIIGTLEYMSPEQAELNNLDIDTRADIYSLGVLLYELLTGSPPFTSRQLRGAAFAEMLRLIREVEPAKPSTKLSSSRELPLIAAKRKLEPKKLTKLMKGDLDWIVMKCLEKERGRRYETANSLALELQRYLADEPVSAGPPSAGYRLRKLLRRNKGRVLAASLLLLALVGGTIGTSLGLVDAERARAAETAARRLAEQERDEKEQARREAVRNEGQALTAVEAEKRAKVRAEASAATEAAQRKQAEAVATLLESVFRDVDPKAEQNGGSDLKTQLVTRLDAAAANLDKEYQGEPLVRARLRNALGQTQLGLGEAAKAVILFQAALEERQAHLGADHLDRLISLNNLALAYQAAGQLDRALPLFEQVVEKSKAKFVPDHPEMLTSLNNLASAYQAAGKLDLALPLFEQTLEKSKAKLGPDDPGTLTAMNNLALAYRAAGQLDKALPLLEQSLEKTKAKMGSDHLDTLSSTNNLALAYQSAGQLDRALPLLEQTLEKRKSKIGPDHPDTLTSTNNLADAYRAAGMLNRALPLFEQTLEKMKIKFGPDHPTTLVSTNSLAGAYLTAGQLDKAVSLFEQTLEKRKAKLGADHPSTLTTMNNLALAYRIAGQLDKALPLLQQTLEKNKAKLGADHPNTLSSTNSLALAYLAAKQPDKAMPLFRDLVAAERKHFGPDDPRFAGVLAPISLALLHYGQHADAEPLLRECLAMREKQQPDLWFTFSTRSMLGEALAGQKKYAEAEPLLLSGYEGMKKREKTIPPQGKIRLIESLERLVHLYDAWGKKDKADDWRKKRDAIRKASPPAAKEKQPRSWKSASCGHDASWSVPDRRDADPTNSARAPPESGLTNQRHLWYFSFKLAINVMKRIMPQELSTNYEAEILDECQKMIGYQFRQPELLRASLTHASGANTRLASNERMEFLGDSILGLVTCEQLYLRFPDYQEGDLTKIKSVVVSRRTCARFSKVLNLGAFLFLGKGMNHLHASAVPPSMLADVYESLVAAIYLDGGLEAARTFILKQLGPEIEEVAEEAHGGNFKSLLQQVAQREFNATPQYVLLDEKGPDHGKCFKIAAVIGRHTYAGAWGRNKKEAEQRAAMNALAQVNGDPVPFEHD